MSIRDTLFQSIAALERLTNIDSEAEKGDYAYSSALQSSATPDRMTLDSSSEKFPFHSREKRAIMDRDREEIKLDITRVVHATYTVGDFLFWALPFLTAALAVTVIGLLADSISFANEHNEAIFSATMASFNNTKHGFDLYKASMYYQPEHLDYDTFYALLVATTASTLGGIVVGALLLWRQRSKKGINLESHKVSALPHVLK